MLSAKLIDCLVEREERIKDGRVWKNEDVVGIENVRVSCRNRGMGKFDC